MDFKKNVAKISRRFHPKLKINQFLIRWKTYRNNPEPAVPYPSSSMMPFFLSTAHSRQGRLRVFRLLP